MIWKVSLSNNEEYDESSIHNILPNPTNVTPWLLLQSYCDQKSLSIKSLSLWDNGSSIRMYTPGKVSSTLPDNIDFRRKYVSTGMSSNTPVELVGFLITKAGVTFGVWCNTATKEVFSSID